MSKIKEAKLNNLTKTEMDNAIYEIPPMEYLDLMDEYNNGKYSYLNPNSENFDEVLDKYANTNLFENEMSIKVAFPITITTKIVDKLIKKQGESGGAWQNMFM